MEYAHLNGIGYIFPYVQPMAGRVYRYGNGTNEMIVLSIRGNQITVCYAYTSLTKTDAFVVVNGVKNTT